MAAQGSPIGCCFAILSRKPIGNRGIVSRCARKRFSGQTTACLQRCRSVIGLQFIEDQCVITRIDNNGNIRMVFCSASDHSRTAHIDILDAGRIVIRLCNRFLKRIQIHNKQIDGANAMRQHGCFMLRIAPNGEKPAMNFRMQRFDTTIHHFRKTGQVRDIPHGEARRSKRLRGSPCRQQLDTARMKRPGKIQEPRFVRHREKGARNTTQITRHRL